MVDRYEQLHHFEDLGLAYPPADSTDDLIGAQKEDPAPVAPGGEVVCPTPSA